MKKILQKKWIVAFGLMLCGAWNLSAQCTDINYTDKTGWTAASSHDIHSSPKNAVDENESNNWSSVAIQVPDMWISVNMQESKKFNQIILEANHGSDWPAGYALYVSNDGINWGSPVATGGGATTTTINFVTQNAQYFKVMTTVGKDNYWVIAEAYVNYIAPIANPAPATDLKATSFNSKTNYMEWTASATGGASYVIERSINPSSDFEVLGTVSGTSYTDNTAVKDITYFYRVIAVLDCDFESAPTAAVEITTGACSDFTYDDKKAWKAKASYSHPTVPSYTANTHYMVDGNINTNWESTDHEQKIGDWIAVDMGSVYKFNQIVIFAFKDPTDDFPGQYNLYVSNNNSDWDNAGSSWGDPLVTERNGVNGDVVDIPMQSARYIKIQLTVDKGNWLKIAEINVGIVATGDCPGDDPCISVPTGNTVTADEETICEGETATITLDASLTDVTYALYIDDVKVNGSEKDGNGGELVWSAGETGIYSIVATGDGVTYCDDADVTLDNTVEITVIPTGTGDCQSVGISNISSEQIIVGYFDTLGRQLSKEPASGVYIIKYDNGTMKKVVK